MQTLKDLLEKSEVFLEETKLRAPKFREAPDAESYTAEDEDQEQE